MAYERILYDYWPMLRVRTRSKNYYQFSNEYPDNTQRTPATHKTRTTSSITLSIPTTTSICQSITQYTSILLTTVITLTRSSTIPLKNVTHLPPGEQPFLRHNHRLPTGPSCPPTSLPDITVDLTSKEDGDTTLYAWYIPFTSLWLRKAPGESHIIPSTHHEH
jgi:hypothetical protein